MKKFTRERVVPIISASISCASGGLTGEAHDMAVQRMVQAGVVPITSGVVLAEFKHDWAPEVTVAGLAAVMGQHGRGSAVAFAWKMQLLNTAVTTNVA